MQLTNFIVSNIYSKNWPNTGSMNESITVCLPVIDRSGRQNKDIENKNTQLTSCKTAKAHHMFRNLKQMPKCFMD